MFSSDVKLPLSAVRITRTDATLELTALEHMNLLRGCLVRLRKTPMDWIEGYSLFRFRVSCQLSRWIKWRGSCVVFLQGSSFLHLLKLLPHESCG